MPIVKMTAPKASTAVFRKKMGQTSPRSDGEHEQEAIHTHRVFHAKPEDLAAGLGLANAEVVAWQYHVHNVRRAPVSLEVKVAAGSDNQDVHTFHELTHGQHVDNVKIILDKLENMKEFEQENYELCLLRIPSLKIIAVWLKASNHERDWFIPVPPSFYGLKPSELCDSASFLKTLQLVAQKFLARPSLDDDDMSGG